MISVHSNNLVQHYETCLVILTGRHSTIFFNSLKCGGGETAGLVVEAHINWTFSGYTIFIGKTDIMELQGYSATYSAVRK